MTAKNLTGIITPALCLATAVLLPFLALWVTASEAGAATYPVVDTGQDQCFSDSGAMICPGSGQAFFGQDAQNAGNQPSYARSADGLTVYDNVTGLTWVQNPDLNGDGAVNTGDKLTYSQAQAYVDTVNAQGLGGFSDWRLPTIKQLYSLIDFRGTDPPVEGTNIAGLIPFIDTAYFGFGYGDTSAGDRIIDSQWVTSTLYAANNGQMFGVNFADGRIKGYGMTTPDPRQPEKTFYVRLCRGDPGYGNNSFVNNGDGTITDNATGLMWTQVDNGQGVSWAAALAWASQKNAENYLGYSDWRLPDAKELHSIVDYTRSPDTTGSAAIDPVFQASEIVNMAGQMDYPFYWSGTSHLSFNGRGDRGVYIAFGRGLGQMNGNIFDVHGAGCQRSDPKDGDPAAYPIAGMGPQGDVQRVFNHVRLLRGR